MIKYLIKRFSLGFFSLFFIVSFVYIICRMIMIENWSSDPHVDFDWPFYKVDYGDYIKGILTEWDWGETNRGKPLWDVLIERAPATLKINIVAFLFYVPMGVLLGVIAAINKGKIADKIIGVFLILFGSVPIFIMTILLVIFFAFYLSFANSVTTRKTCWVHYPNDSFIHDAGI